MVPHLPANRPQTGNLLLDRLTGADFALLWPHLEPVLLPLRQSLATAGRPFEHAYFIQNGMASVVTPLIDGAMIEVGLIGREGLVGVQILLGADIAHAEIMVQLQGAALRISAEMLRNQVAASASLFARLLRYVHAFHVQVSQSAACNGRHGVNERLARWLLMVHDRAEGDVLPLSHEFVAMMIGVRRPSAPSQSVL